MLPELYSNWSTVVKQTPAGRELLEESLVPENSQSVPVTDLLEYEAAVSISSKLSEGVYNTTPYALWHDLKLALGRKLANREIGSPDYIAARRLVAAAIDLLLREGARLGLLDPTEPRDIGDAFVSQQLREGFAGIFVDIQETYGEAYFVVSQNGPLFTSQLSRAPQDPRTTPQAGSVHVTRLMPLTAQAPAEVLGYAVPPPDARASAAPTATPTEMLQQFVSLSRTPLVPAKWIEYDLFASFASEIDSSDALVGIETAEAVWIDRAAAAASVAGSSLTSAGLNTASTSTSYPSETTPFPSISSSRGSHMPPGTISPKKEDLPPNPNLGLHSRFSSQELSREPSRELSEEFESDFEDDEPEDLLEPVLPDGPEVDLATVLEWTPRAFVDDDEITAASSGTQVELASRLLLELQYLQRERLAAPAPITVGDRERHIALKTQNVLCRLVGQASGPEETGTTLSSKLPVLVRNYVGTLPSGERIGTGASGPPPPPPMQPGANRMSGPRNVNLSGGPPSMPQRLAGLGGPPLHMNGVNSHS